jgi:hypothetical protein
MSSHIEAAGQIAAKPELVFERLDDQTRLAQHMEESSMMMGGGRMTYDFDKAQGRAIGSRIKMSGEAFGLSVFAEEIVTERDPPRRKVWHTVGTPRLLVISSYQMGFEIVPAGSHSQLRVWIDYELPSHGVGRWLGAVAGKAYARWCVNQMVSDAVRHFAQSPLAARPAHA